MSSIWRIFLDDCRYTRSNFVTVLVMLLLFFAPVAYAWTTIAANWNPYRNGANLKVAVANSDDGYESELVPIEMNIGDRVVDKLRDNNDYGWVFVGEDVALEGVRSGEYYAAIVIPADFSSKMMSALASKSDQASVDFFLNEKMNPVAATTVGGSATGAAEDIGMKFTEAVDVMSAGLASDLVSYAGGSQSEEFGSRLVSRLGEVADDFDSAAAQARMLSSLAEASSSLTSVMANTLSHSDDAVNASSDFIGKSTEALDAAVESARTAASDIEKQVKDAKSKGNLSGVGTETASKLVRDIGTLVSSVTTMEGTAKSTSQLLQDTTQGLVDPKGSMVRELDGVRDDLGASANKLNASASKIRKFQDDIASAVAQGDYSLLAGVIGNNSAGYGRWLADPVQVERQVVYPVGNYGSSIAPLYLSLSIWAGLVLLALMMGTGISEARLRRYEEEAGCPLKSYQRYFGRYLVFLVFSLLQATVMAIGTLFFLHVQCVQPLLFLAACWVCAIAFSGIVYALVASLGNVGKALCVLMLVVQAIGMGGGLPSQIMGSFFQVVNMLMPFTHGIAAMQASAAGIVGSEYAVALLCLMAFFALALVFGLALSRRDEPIDIYHERATVEELERAAASEEG